MKTALDHVSAIAEILVEKLCSAKTAHDMSLQDMSEKSGVSKSTISKLLSGNIGNPNVFTVAAICKTLDVSLDAIFEISHSENSPELQNKLDYCERTLADREKQLKQARQGQYLLFAFAMFLLALVGYIVCDALHPAWGLFRY